MRAGLVSRAIALGVASAVGVVPPIAAAADATRSGLVLSQIGTGMVSAGVGLQPGGKIVTAGSAYLDGAFKLFVMRHHADGRMDATFGQSGSTLTPIAGWHAHATSLAIQRDDKIVVGGYVSRGNEAPSDFLTVRYLSSGEIDAGFNKTGWTVTDVSGDHDHGAGLVLQDDGRIVQVGITNARYMLISARYDFALIRLDPDGRLDRTFGNRGKVVTRVGTTSEDTASAAALQSDRRIVTVGYSRTRYEPDFTVVRHLPDGRLDRTFGDQGKVVLKLSEAGSSATGVAVQPDKRILVVGNAARAPHFGEAASVVARLRPDGGLDRSFGDAGVVTLGARLAGRKIALQDDGKIVVAGGGPSAAGSRSGVVVARLLPNGRIDSSFGEGGVKTVALDGQWLTVSSVLLQRDGMVLLAGSLSPGRYSYKDRSSTFLVRMTGDGHLPGRRNPA